MLAKKSIKQFLKLDWRKIIATLIFIILSSYPPVIIGQITHNNSAPITLYSSGFPIPYYIYETQIDVFYLFLFLDIIFWYFISYLLIFIWDKIKGKKPIV
ncbi:MAG: hypothetical protein V1732_04765 [Patescibacteria group bacterium]